MLRLSRGKLSAIVMVAFAIFAGMAIVVANRHIGGRRQNTSASRAGQQVSRPSEETSDTGLLTMVTPFGGEVVKAQHPAPDLELRVLKRNAKTSGAQSAEIAGEKMRLSSLRGKKIVVLFLSSYT